MKTNKVLEGNFFELTNISINEISLLEVALDSYLKSLKLDLDFVNSENCNLKNKEHFRIQLQESIKITSDMIENIR